MESNDGLERPSSNCVVPSHDCAENVMGSTAIGIDDVAVSKASAPSIPEISLPHLKYGYCTKPLKWDELVDIICEHKDLAKLSRSEQQQYDYELFKRNTLLHWKTMTDFVLCTKFSNIFTKKTVEDAENGPRFVADPPIERLLPSQTYTALVKNDFPYYMADGIEHWILWKLGFDCNITDQDIQKAKEELSDRLQTEGSGMIHWVNPLHLKSIPLIEHAHILGRVKNHPVASDRV
jgi:Protein of unknown function (DUF3605)